MAEAAVLKRKYEDAPVSNLYLFGRKEDLAFEQPVGDNPRVSHPEIEPERLPWSYCYLGDLQKAAGRNAESRSSYEKGLANWQKLVKPDVAKPENPTAVRGTGVALQRLGWSAEAAVAYRQALALLEGGKEPDWFAVACCRSLLAAVASEPGSGVTADE